MAQIEFLKAEELHFDPSNPRLAEYTLSGSSEEATMRLLWKEMDVKELVMSILANGFFESEPLYVIKEKEKWIVIEGNRRLAAIKAILDPSILASGMDAFSEQISSEFQSRLAAKVPVVKMDSRQDAWRYIGFKHVKGAAKWDSYAKAKYIAQVHRDYNVSLTEIAEQIGDSHRTALRLYRGLSILEQAEKMTEFKREDVYYGRIYFSHLYTALGYDGYARYLGIEDTSAEEFIVNQDHAKQLLQVMRWLFGSSDQSIVPIIKRQNPDLRNLSQVLQKEESVQVLLATSSLDRAYDNSQDSNEVLRTSLVEAKLKIEDALAKVSIYDGRRDALELASEVGQASARLFDSLKTVYDKSHRIEENRFAIDDK